MKKLTFALLLTLMAIFSAQAAKVYLKVAGFVTDNVNSLCLEDGNRR